MPTLVRTAIPSQYLSIVLASDLATFLVLALMINYALHLHIGI